MKDAFIRCLENNDLQQLRKIPKSDLHSHAPRGGNVKFIEEWSGISIAKPPAKFNDLHDMQRWYEEKIKIHCKGQLGYLKRIEAAFSQAKQDGVSVLCMSFGMGEEVQFDNDLKAFINVIDEIHKNIAPSINFIPEICFSRTDDIGIVEAFFDKLLSLKYFKAIDLIGNDSQPVDKFKTIYRRAKNSGLILKAHVGEFGDADSIREAVEILELQQVQHGISAVQSKEVMKWLASNKIQLNICPTSNVMLSRVDNYSTHPIKELYHNGIPVTINSDDMLIFNSSVSEEYLYLYNAGLFSAIELNEIREIGLRT